MKINLHSNNNLLTSAPGWSLNSSGASIDIGAGLGYAISENLSLDASFRYMLSTMNETTDSDGDKVKVEVNSILFCLGGRYIF